MNKLNPRALHDGVKEQVVENILEGNRTREARHRLFGKKLVLCDTPFPEGLSHTFPEKIVKRIGMEFMGVVLEYIRKIAEKEESELYCGTLEVARHFSDGPEKNIGVLILTQSKNDLQYGDIYQYVFDKDYKVVDLVHQSQEEVKKFLEASKFYVFA